VRAVEAAASASVDRESFLRKTEGRGETPAQVVSCRTDGSLSRPDADQCDAVARRHVRCGFGPPSRWGVGHARSDHPWHLMSQQVHGARHLRLKLGCFGVSAVRARLALAIAHIGDVPRPAGTGDGLADLTGQSPRVPPPSCVCPPLCGRVPADRLARLRREVGRGDATKLPVANGRFWPGVAVRAYGRKLPSRARMRHERPPNRLRRLGGPAQISVCSEISKASSTSMPR